MPYSLDGDLALEAIFSSNGFALSVSDEEMVKAVKLLAKYEACLPNQPEPRLLQDLSKPIELE